jgi:hypothetical protein
MESMLILKILSIKGFSIKPDKNDENGYLKIWLWIEEKAGVNGLGDNSISKKLHLFQERSFLSIFSHNILSEAKL